MFFAYVHHSLGATHTEKGGEGCIGGKRRRIAVSAEDRAVDIVKKVSTLYSWVCQKKVLS
jgi:hypothetical protein